MPVKTQGTMLGDLLKYEAEALYCREQVTVLAGAGAARELTMGMVLGRVTKGAANAAAEAGNTGDGAITAHPAVGADAKVGVYRLTCIKAAQNGGLFLVEDPDGIVIGEASVGVQFAKHLTFTIADGAADFVVGDAFTITVLAGSGKYVQFKPAATDGANVACGVLLFDCSAADGADNPDGVALVRGPAIVADGELLWPAGIQAEDKAAALAALTVLGILARTEA